ncbi:hypothetical protein [Spirosoma endophyticum]|uniref:Uncharacterized protein n=1 Tax=Spirosoma endophyticum TaxID=662367 RepID=A0A1I1LVS7_9BACT|nr:hypothetical protein [Spirosoma endophyticum]SFC77016.1 hypothetical protein SAMN05216167_102361 [Spirosoma endophyticum]
MNVKQVYQLKQGTKVLHQHYGLCTVDGVIRSYGPLLLPDTIAGRNLLSGASRTPLGTPVVEPLFHLLTRVSLPTSILSSDNPNPLTGTMPRF